MANGNWTFTTTYVQQTVPGYYTYVPIAATYTTSYSSNLGWNASARSINSILGDGVGKFSPRVDVVGAVVGLTTIPASVDPSYNGIAYGIYFASGIYRVLENGFQKTGNYQYAAGDIFSITRTNGIITYAKNGVIFYKSAKSTIDELVMDASLYSASDIILDASLVDGSSMDMAYATIEATSELYGLQKPVADILAQSTVGFSGKYTTSNAVHANASIITSSALNNNKEFGGSPTITASATLAAIGYVAVGVSGSLTPLVAFATSGYPTYAGISASLSSLVAYAGTGQIVPTSSGIAASFVSMSAIAHCLTGENTLPNTAYFGPMEASGTSRYGTQPVFTYAAISAGLAPMICMLGEYITLNSYALLEAPSFSLSAFGTANAPVGVNTGFFNTTISARSGGNATGEFTTLSLASTATLTETGSAALPFITTTLTSFVNVAERGTASIGFISSTVIGLAGGNASLWAPSFSFTGSGIDTTGVRGKASLGFILTNISAAGTYDERGSMAGGFISTFLSYASINIPAPSFTLSSAGSVALANAIAYVFNTRTNESTTYSNYPFIGIIHIDRKPYGVKTDGLYLLEGLTDITAVIKGSITTKDSDFGFFNSKNIEQIYLNSDTITTITPIVDGVTAPAYPSSFTGRRAALARGLAGRYWRFKIDGIQKLEGLEATCILRQRSVK